MKKNIIFILLSITIACSSCLDKFDESNPNTSTADQINTLANTQSILNAVYNALYNQNLMSIQEMTLCSDMGYPGYGRMGNPTNATLAAYYDQTYTYGFAAVSAKWSALYAGIYRANQTIEGLNSLLKKGYSETDESWITQMAQARFFRGLFHFYLHSVYNNGEIIIADKVPVTDADKYKSVSSSEDVIKFFREDLKYAYDNLPAKWGSKDERVTKGTAATILGTSYLYQNDFDEALVYFSDVINNPDYGYKLETDMAKMFTTAGEFNSESIFEINYQLGIHPDLSSWDTNAPTNSLGDTQGTSSFTLPCWLITAYQDEKVNSKDARNKVYYTNEQGEECDSIRNLSFRASAMVAIATDDYTPYYLNPITSAKVAVNEKGALGYYRKYTNWDIIDDENNLPDGQHKSGKNVTVNRLSDVYLMYAECMLRKSSPNVGEALKYMNLIRQRWGLELLGTPAQNADISPDNDFNGVEYDAESLFKQLQDIDRPLELSAEGYASRFIDLRRWGIAKERFEELSNRIYHLEWKKYTVNGIEVKGNKFLYEGEGDPSKKPYTFTDYVTAAKNYDSARNGYWPIPLSEVTNNPNLYNKK